RYDAVGLTNKLESSGSKLSDWDDSNRWTAALTWTPTEYSQMRLQYAKADISIDDESNDFDYVYLQYLMSMGSHGAHKF
ncbi:MAG: porin, partial [Candidatus Thiodiazotropha sp.]